MEIKTPCSVCGYINTESAAYCGLCYHVLRKEIKPGAPPAAGPLPSPARENKKINWLWPHIVDMDSARKAAYEGAYVTVFICVVISICATYGFLGLNETGYIDVAVYSLFAWAVFSKVSRLAALGTLLYFVAGLFITHHARSQNGTSLPPGTFIPVAFYILAFINSIRGTLLYHYYLREKLLFGGGPDRAMVAAPAVSVSTPFEAAPQKHVLFSAVPRNVRPKQTKLNNSGQFRCPQCDQPNERGAARCLLCGEALISRLKPEAQNHR